MFYNHPPFEEEAFNEFLTNTNSSKPYLFSAAFKDSKKNFRFVKVYNEVEDYVDIFEYLNNNTETLSSLNTDKKLSSVGIYFKHINVFVSSKNYHSPHIFGELKNVTYFSLDRLIEEINLQLNQELTSRKDDLNNLLEINATDYNKRKSLIKSSIFRKLIRREHIPRLMEINKQIFKKSQTIDMLYRFLKDGEKYIKEYIDCYVQENPNLVKKEVIYLVAQSEIVKSLSNDPIILKGQKITYLFENPLKNASAVAVITHTDKRITVAKNLEIYSNKVKVGNMDKSIDIFDIERFELGINKYVL